MLVVDEFYKVSKDNDKDRYEKLQNAIVKLGKISSQKYFLAPNITNISDNPITQ
ncbi:MAG: hypothetical protein LBP53_06280 [Candidatus Peribacteria bacterium]|nr:hypothetical protein [Candidatus Peribacteria bacterium]